MENDGFIDITFCPDCVNFVECTSSKYGLNLLEKFMILKALHYLDDDIKTLLLSEFEVHDFNLDDVNNFIKNKIHNCIYLT